MKYMIRKISLVCLIVAGVAFGVTDLSAQTTFGVDLEPEEGAILDLKQQMAGASNITSTKGVVLPRVQLTSKTSLKPLVATETTDNKKSHIGAAVYNVNVVASTTTVEGLQKGLYIWGGTEWQLVDGGPSLQYFYMPPFDLPLGTSGTSYTVDLYAEYIKRFTQSNTNPSTSNPLYVTSEGNTYTLPGLYNRYDLYYVVLDHSSDIKVTSINNSGSMTYSATNNTVSDNSYLNIILVVKD